MKKLMTMALVVLMGAAACQKETPDYTDNTTPTNGDYVSFTADFATLASKAASSYDEDSKTLTLSWEAGDQVGVYSSQTPILYKATTAGASTTLTTNIKVATASSYSALYPYLTDALMEDGRLALNIPAEQTAVADQLKYHVAVAKTSSTAFSFKNVTAAVRLHIMADNVTKVEVKGNAGELVAGDIKVNTENASFSGPLNGVSKVTLLPAVGSSVIEPGFYYASLIPQNLSQGLTVTYYIGENSFEQKDETAIALDGNTLIVCESFGTSVEGSKSNPFQVGSVTDLQGLSEKLALDVPNYVVMTKDIDMTGVTSWTPISNSRTAATVPEIHFDGKGYAIKNFAPTSITAGDGGTQTGFFGTLYGSCTNLTFTDAVVNISGNSTVAVVAAFAGLDGRGDLITTFDNVHVTGTVVGKKVVAGFAATINKCSFKNCSSAVNVTASDNHVASFVARCAGSGNITFENCHATGNVENTKSSGRFVGGFYGGDEVADQNMKFTNCYATGNFKCGYQAAAFVGYFDGGTYEVTNCYATGSNTAHGTSKQYGGLVGVNKGNLTINNCYYTGTVTSNKAESVGGIIGLNGIAGEVKINNSFVVADLTSTTYGVGGIVGHTKGAALTVSNCYAAGVLTCPDQVGGIVGLAETATTIKDCVFGGTLPASATNKGDIVGKQVVEATVTNSAAVTEAAKPDYATASKIATKLGWSTDVWDLSADVPTLK